MQVMGLAAAAPWRRVLDEARAALRRYRLSEADREDVVQCVALVAYRRWHTYRAADGTVGQWIGGIVRFQVWRLWRSRERDEKAEAFVDPGEGDTPEMVALRRVVAQRLLARLPEARRRAVMLVELEGRTLAEAAALEGSSITRMHARYHAGLAALRARVNRPPPRHQTGEARGQPAAAAAVA
jgi:DNA-directed RNA polymerase specialized sigma24 family protein